MCHRTFFFLWRANLAFPLTTHLLTTHFRVSEYVYIYIYIYICIPPGRLVRRRPAAGPEVSPAGRRIELIAIITINRIAIITIHRITINSIAIITISRIDLMSRALWTIHARTHVCKWNVCRHRYRYRYVRARGIISQHNTCYVIISYHIRHVQ